MQQFKIALFIDVDNVKLKKEALEELINKLQRYGKIAFGKLYNYSDRKNKDLNAIIETNGFTTAMLTEMNKKTKHNYMDLRIAIDSTKLSITSASIDAFCFYSGQIKGDIAPLISSLKADGKYCIEATSNFGASICSLFDDQLIIYKSLEIKPKADKPKVVVTINRKPKVANETINAVPTEPALQNVKTYNAEPALQNVKTNAETFNIAATNAEVANLSKEQIMALAKSQIEEEAAKIRSEEKAKIAKELNDYKEKELLRLETQKKEIEESVQKELAEHKKLEAIRVKREQNVLINEKKMKLEEDYIENFKDAKTLNEKLEDFAERTNKLDFDYNKDIDAKLSLIYDIEECLAEEALEGRGKNSTNEQESKAFTEIESLILNLKETILSSMDKELVNEANYPELQKDVITDADATEADYYENDLINKPNDDDYDF